MPHHSLALAASVILAACQAPSNAPLVDEAAKAGASEASAPSAAELEAADEAAVAAVLDDWHKAAAVADGARYFGHMTDDAIFLGTDASERWTVPAFRAFCEPYFSKGIGWTYKPRQRHVRIAGDLAWFDEKLWNDKYGECRGTGVLARREGEWRIEHYSLTLPVPNDLAADVVKLIRGK
jgi:uncharacterized protein (TIGR02246 family)